MYIYIKMSGSKGLTKGIPRNESHNALNQLHNENAQVGNSGDPEPHTPNTKPSVNAGPSGVSKRNSNNNSNNEVFLDEGEDPDFKSKYKAWLEKCKEQENDANLKKASHEEWDAYSDLYSSPNGSKGRFVGDSYFKQKLAFRLPAEVSQPSRWFTQPLFPTHLTSYKEALDKGEDYYLQYVPSGKIHRTERNHEDRKFVDYVPAHYKVVFVSPEKADEASKSGRCVWPQKTDYDWISDQRDCEYRKEEEGTGSETPKIYSLGKYSQRPHTWGSSLGRPQSWEAVDHWKNNIDKTGNYRLTKKQPKWNLRSPFVQRMAVQGAQLAMQVQARHRPHTLERNIAAMKLKINGPTLPTFRNSNNFGEANSKPGLSNILPTATAAYNNKAVISNNLPTVKLGNKNTKSNKPGISPLRQTPLPWSPEVVKRQTECAASGENECPAYGTYTNLQGKTRQISNIRAAEEQWVQNHKAVNSVLGKATATKNNVCGVNSTMCEGHVGVHRHLMPQLEEKNTPALMEGLRVMGVGVNASTRTPGQLHATQDEMRGPTIAFLEKEIREGRLTGHGLNAPIIVSSDGGVIDGHHRWAAWRRADPDRPIPVIVVDLPSSEALAAISGAMGAKTAYQGPIPQPSLNRTSGGKKKGGKKTRKHYRR